MKSDALLHAALEYVDTPGYSALLLRRTFPDLSKPGALMDVAGKWLSPHIPAVKWSAEKKQWRFPSGAVLQFGHLDDENDKYKYQSSEYQFIGFDELTQFTETQYLYLFSRLTRLKGVDIPLRMRAATNPGGEGHEWVKERFIPDDWSTADAEEFQAWRKDGFDEKLQPFTTWFVPSRYTDNPFIDQEAYRLALDRLDPVTRDQLSYGDWDIAPGGRLYFDRTAIMRFVPVKPTLGELAFHENNFGESVLDFSSKPGGILALWSRPEKGRQYVIGNDTASGRDANRGKGRISADWSVSMVRDLDSGEQVARLRGQISERHFGEYIYRLHRWYNNAYIVHLLAGGYGQAALDRMVDCGVLEALLYHSRDERKTHSTGSDIPGFIESTVSRPKFYGWLHGAIADHSIEDYDAVTINEYLSFETNSDGKPEARSGRKDDCVSASAATVVGLMRAPRNLKTGLQPSSYGGKPTQKNLTPQERKLQEIIRVDNYKKRM